MVKRGLFTSILVGAAVILAGCGSGPADGWVSVGTGDTYGEW